MMYTSADFKRELARVQRARTRNTVLAVVLVIAIVALLTWFLLGPVIN